MLLNVYIGTRVLVPELTLKRFSVAILCKLLIFSEKKLFKIKIVLCQKKFCFNVLQKEFNVIQYGVNVFWYAFNAIQYLVSNKMRRIFASARRENTLAKFIEKFGRNTGYVPLSLYSFFKFVGLKRECYKMNTDESQKETRERGAGNYAPTKPI